MTETTYRLTLQSGDGAAVGIDGRVSRIDGRIYVHGEIDTDPSVTRDLSRWRRTRMPIVIDGKEYCVARVSACCILRGGVVCRDPRLRDPGLRAVVEVVEV